MCVCLCVYVFLWNLCAKIKSIILISSIQTSFLPDVSKISSLTFTPDNVYVPKLVCSLVARCLSGNSFSKNRQINAVLPTFSGPRTTTRYGSSRFAALSMMAVSISWRSNLREKIRYGFFHINESCIRIFVHILEHLFGWHTKMICKIIYKLRKVRSIKPT